MTPDQHDPLETAWRNASSGLIAEEAFLRELAGRSVLVILYQPPGPGAAAPERNLVQWQHQTSGKSFVPIFTDTLHLTIPIPAPAQAVRVPMRVLVAVGDGKRFLINPLSSSSFELDETRVAKLRAFIEARSQESEAPSQHAPWAFRLPDDALYPVAVGLVEWFNANGRVSYRSAIISHNVYYVKLQIVPHGPSSPAPLNCVTGVTFRQIGFASILNSQRSLSGFLLFLLRITHRLEQCCGIRQPGCSGLDFGQLCVLPALLARDSRRI